MQLQNQNASLLQQLHQKEQEAIKNCQQQQEHHQQIHQHQLEKEASVQQLQLQLKDVQEQFGSLQNQHLHLQKQSAIDSEASLSALHRLQEQLNASQEKQLVEAAAATAAVANNKLIQNELQAARDRIKYLESAVSGHVTRLEAQAKELSGKTHHHASLATSVAEVCIC